MTLVERNNEVVPRRCDVLSECRIATDKKYLRELLSREDEVFVFRRNTATGKYSMSTACCEEVLPPASK